MAEHLRFSIVYWHTMCGQGGGYVRRPTAIRPGITGKTGIEIAKARVPVFFEIAEKLRMPFYAFHDRDVAPARSDARESNEYLDTIVACSRSSKQRTGTSSCSGARRSFSCIRFMNGAATRPETRRSSVFAAQVRRRWK